jgi:hypothetical protein
MEETGLGDNPLPGEDEPHWDGMSTEELTDLALGSDLWLNAPALSHLGERSPEAARPVAIQALQSSDTLLAATALRVLAVSDMDIALDYMGRTAPTWPLWILDSMVEVLAVDHPIHDDRAPELLNQIARRLSQPANSKEYNLAELFFRQYPQLRIDGG